MDIEIKNLYHASKYMKCTFKCNIQVYELAHPTCVHFLLIPSQCHFICFLLLSYCGGYDPGYPWQTTWAAPSGVAQPIRRSLVRHDDEDIATLDTPTPWSSPSCNSFPTHLLRRPRIQQTRRHCFGHNFLLRHRNRLFLDALERGRRRHRFGSGPSSRRSVDHSV